MGFVICMVDIYWFFLVIFFKICFKNNLYLLDSEYGIDNLFNVFRMEKNICILSYLEFLFNVFRMENNSYLEFILSIGLCWIFILI